MWSTYQGLKGYSTISSVWCASASFRHTSSLQQAQISMTTPVLCCPKKLSIANEYTPLPQLVDKGAQRILSDGLWGNRCRLKGDLEKRMVIISDGILRQHSEEGAAAITCVFKGKSSLTAITRMGEFRSSLSTLRSEKELLLMQDSENQLLRHQATT